MEGIGAEAQKFCHGCKRWQPLEEFSFKDKAKRKRRSRCRACCREVSRRHYEQNKAAYIDRKRRRQPLERRRIAGAVLAYLRVHPCTGCGKSDPIVLEFNHLDPTSKLGNIGQIIIDCVSKARLAAEIAKCEVLCANCHQRQTISSKLAHYKLGALTRGPAWRVAANRRNSAFVLERLRGAKCIDCGLADPLVLQFDHRPGEGKIKDIGWFVSSGSRLGLLKGELGKCDVRCANCHRKRTAKELGWFRATAAA